MNSLVAHAYVKLVRELNKIKLNYFLMQELLDDPFYMGLYQKRDCSQMYDDLIDEFMEAVVEK